MFELRTLVPNRPPPQQKKSGPEWEVRVPTEPGRLRRETAFLCNIRFKNDLPEVPCYLLPSGANRC